MRTARLLAGAAVVLAAGCSSPVAGAAAPAPAAAPAAAPTTVVNDANRQVCADLDARGGQYYSTVVIPMMSGESKRKSIEVNVAALSHAVTQVAQVGSDGSLALAAGKVAEDGRQMVSAAEAFQVMDNAEGTALLTAFVGLTVTCSNAGHKPTWFDVNELQG